MAEIDDTDFEYDRLVDCRILLCELASPSVTGVVVAPVMVARWHKHYMERWHTKNMLVKEYVEWISPEQAERQQYPCVVKTAE